MARSSNRYMVKNDSEICYKVALYARVSVKNKYNNSIDNQIMLIEDYIEKSDFEDYVCLKKIYIDDGVSGYSFNRKAFIELLEDVKTEKVNCIIVKDLSRLGRRYLELYSYIENVLQIGNVRLISINDGYDSKKDSREILYNISIIGMFNEMYVKDTGNKIRNIKGLQQIKGEYIGIYPPYGYTIYKEMSQYNKEIANNTIRRGLKVDRLSAKIVQEIFSEYVMTRKISYVIATLYKKRVNIRRDYYKSGKIYDEQRKTWTYASIKSVLSNEVYIGNMVQRKYYRINEVSEYDILKEDYYISTVGKSRLKNSKQEEYIKVEHTHEPIIDRELFYKVQEMLYRHTRRK